MKLLESAFFTDENIRRDVVLNLREQGLDVLDTCEQNLQGSPDIDLIRLAFASGRVIITHDNDFGTLAVLAGEPIIGIVYIRPGHIDANFTIDTLAAVLNEGFELSPPFILVAHRKNSHVSMRLRTL